MNHLPIKVFIVILLCLIATSVYAVECDNPKSSDDAAYCLGVELRESDTKINEKYKTLMSKLPANEKEKLRKEQRAWIKERDDVCNCTNKQSDRGKWYKELLKDYRKTVCVTRYTRQRTKELDGMLSDLTQKAAVKNNAPPIRTLSSDNFVVHSQKGYQLFSNNSKVNGKWYLEAFFKFDKITKEIPIVIWAGCYNESDNINHGILFQISNSNTNDSVFQLGFALDLDNGKLYVRTNGKWDDGEPGSFGGLDLNPGRAYHCGVETTTPIIPLIGEGYLDLEAPFAYLMPNGYQPFSEN